MNEEILLLVCESQWTEDQCVKIIINNGQCEY